MEAAFLLYTFFNATGYAGVLYHIPDYKRLEEQLRQAQMMKAGGPARGGCSPRFQQPAAPAP